MSTTDTGDQDPLEGSIFYQEFLIEKDEILRHKWIESEKAGYDIGFEKALIDWMLRHRSCWLDRRRKEREAREARRFRSS
ncbi:hypothetical protein CfE428DRAFT_1640 [Chthoniobacter flavus Ellin428]|uniref:DUF4032 domain-containing protein n=1 Tax=Chthoniobacter flavus Ellin428 TaxID=497964 RepID=B4CX27_9BACT|nr:hypothetical protein [Chthoniobacter flavus]EDY21347.1 hypothetical protein CfE428DRAFT_1640 [Chthoniobacter flavus Ellin428]TCO84884.1 hypothetical protein EV701_1334 [Chthoniobacter flavus]